VSESSTRGRRKSLIGTVVSVKMDKTAVVSVERHYPHQLYHKIIRSTKRYKAHDPENGAVLGDTVRIVETRPISKEKRWRIAETMVRGNVADLAPRDIGAPEEAMHRPERPEPVASVADAVPDTSEEGAAVVETLVTGDVVDEAPAAEAAAEEAASAPATEAAAEDAATAEAEDEAAEDSKE
jgi:small subunit ribosomal protein S17